MKIIQTEEEFRNEIKKDKVVVDFYADWCGPCKMISPILEELEKEEDFELIKVNTDDFMELSREYGIMSIPNLKIFEKGKLTKESIGLKSKSELRDLLK